MSITICWRPTSKNDKHFNGGTSSSFAVLEQTFGKTIGPEHLPALRGMARAASDAFYDEVADVVERVGEITIWGEY